MAEYKYVTLCDPVLLFWKATFKDAGPVILAPDEKDAYLAESDETPVSLEKVYLSQSEYDALPEFES